MGLLYDDAVIIRQSEKEGEPCVITVNCPDKTGLGCDLCRIILFFGLTIVRIGMAELQSPKHADVFLLKFCCNDRPGLLHEDGKKIVEPSKQNSLRSRLEIELSRPLRVALISRGPDTELLVANPIELSGKGRPLVFYDITLALKMLNRPVFSAEIGRYGIGDREWEVYRVLLDEGDGSFFSKKEIKETVWKMLMSWED
ncbi:act domain-containing protein acr10 [Phtheirospermum japonicum]|uniref:ACT domain-containing protein ACR n=1 Tax=Phtheirospermum japonicum TaxID=374723 RepID=A0A830BTL6_9LAMI|nr:act domain-containing protein acr10 [Phtheirospermum japonicum]